MISVKRDGANGGRIVIINPYGLHIDIPGYGDLVSDGFNPLLALDTPADVVTVGPPLSSRAAREELSALYGDNSARNPAPKLKD